MSLYLTAIMATLIWGSSGIFVSLIDLPILTIVFIRTLIPTLFALIFIYKLKHILFLKKKVFFIVSLLSLSTLTFQFYGYKLAPVPLVSVLLYCWPLIYYFLALFFKQEVFMPIKLCLSLVAFMGILLINLEPTLSFSSSAYLGLFFGFLAAISMACQIMLIKLYMQDESSYSMLYIYNVLGALVLCPFFVLHLQALSLYSLNISIFFGLFIGTLSFIMYFKCLQKLPGSTMALVSYLEVPSSILLSSLLLKEGVTLLMILGIFLVLFSSITILTLKPNKKLGLQQ